MVGVWLVGVLDAFVKWIETLTQLSLIAEGPPDDDDDDDDDFSLSLLCGSGRVMELGKMVPVRNPAPEHLVLKFIKAV